MAVAISSNFPLTEDLEIEILLRLPVKSLLRFRAVCKGWHTVISSENFIKKHFHHEGNRTHLHAYWCGGVWSDEPSSMEPEIAYLSFSHETLETLENPSHLQLSMQTEISFLRGPCNGIFCVEFEWCKLALWNPATRRFRPIPCPFSFEFCEIGFGMDALTDDYKVVLITGESGIVPSFAIYTSSNDSWRYSEDNFFIDLDDVVTKTSSGTTFLNGFCYWMKNNTTFSTSTILAFDMYNEVFQEIEIPEIVRSRLYGELHLYNNDTLALFSFDKYVDLKRIDIWLMKEKGSWTKFVSVVMPFPITMTFGFLNRNEIIVSLLVNRNKELMMYDLDSNTIRNFRIEKRDTIGVWPFYYKESLMSVKGGKGIQDYDIQSVISRDYIDSKEWPI